MFKEDEFWESERDSPLFNRSGLASESNLKMLLPKFRNIHRISKSLLEKTDYTSKIRKCNSENNVKNGNKMENSEKKFSSGSTDNNSSEPTNTTTNTMDTRGTMDNTVKVGGDGATVKSAAVTAAPEGATNTNTIVDTNTKDTNKVSSTVGEVSTVDSKDKTGVLGPHAVTEEMSRIFKLDSERTFKSINYREQFYNNLCLVYERLGDYHQGEGFVIALFSIYLNAVEVVNVMTVMSQHYLPGYFSSKPKHYVRDSKVLMLLLERRNKKLHQVLSDLIVPEAFVSKWFIGLGVHIFDFEAISTLLNYLFEQGQIFLFKLGLSFFENFAEEITSNPDVSYVLKLLRLDDEVIPKDDYERSKIYYDVLMGAFEQDVTEPEVEELRKKVEKDMKHEEEMRLLREKMLNYEEDEIVFSDEE